MPAAVRPSSRMSKRRHRIFHRGVSVQEIYQLYASRALSTRLVRREECYARDSQSTPEEGREKVRIFRLYLELDSCGIEETPDEFFPINMISDVREVLCGVSVDQPQADMELYVVRVSLVGLYQIIIRAIRSTS